ncbi:MAG: hypothetical protein M3Y82_14310 [Verrucomicrobiota bacterium]|nr:hypothetical protein [Verrucomicrobiota bacterium]
MMEATVNFSNAVVVAMLPYISDVAKKLELPLPLPVTRQPIAEGGPNSMFENRNGQMGGCGFVLKEGWIFGFDWGYFDHFETPHSYYTLQDPDDIPKFVGKVRMTKDEAVQMARDTLRKLEIPLEAVFAEQEPRVTLPPKTRTGIVPHYRIEWLDPRGGWTSVDIEVDAEAKHVELINIGFNANLRRPWPKFGVAPVLRKKSLAANPEYAWKLLPIVLRAVDDYGKTLGLHLPRPLTTNQVARFEVSDNGGWPHTQLELTNGWRFIYRNSMVNGFYAPDDFFASDQRPILIKEFTGNWNMTEKEAIELVRRTLAKLNYPTNLVHMDFPPQIIKPALAGIPRYSFSWNVENAAKDDLQSKIEAEVDADKGELKSLYYDDKAYWNKPPPIDVPISLSTQNRTNTTPAKNPSQPIRPKTPPRKLTPLPIPQK